MKYPRLEKLEKYPEYQRKAYLQKFIRFNWFIDEHSLLEAIIRLNLHRLSRGYLVDDDFIRYVFKDCTFNDTVYIAHKLYQDAVELEKKKCESFGITFDIKKVWCSKSRSIFADLKDKFYQENPHYTLAHSRRICCGCHETGSLAKRKELI